MNIGQIRKLTSTFSTVGNEMGLNEQTLTRDVSDIFTGKNVQKTSLGKQLGLTSADIEKEKAAGNIIQEVYRPDPNVNIRSGIYKKSFEQIKGHPIFGIGWGSMGKILLIRLVVRRRPRQLIGS